MSKRKLSVQAQVAVKCRSVLKDMGIKHRVISRSFSGGSSVTIYVPWSTELSVCQDIHEFVRDYVMGRHCALTDRYIPDNIKDDIPQVKHIDVQRTHSLVS